jgi:hypothetical protein
MNYGVTKKSTEQRSIHPYNWGLFANIIQKKAAQMDVQ